MPRIGVGWYTSIPRQLSQTLDHTRQWRRRFIFPSAARAHTRARQGPVRGAATHRAVSTKCGTRGGCSLARERERHFRGPAAGKRPVWRRFTSLGRFHDTRSARRAAVSDQPPGASVVTAHFPVRCACARTRARGKDPRFLPPDVVN
jgi:hypothetical protein